MAKKKLTKTLKLLREIKKRDGMTLFDIRAFLVSQAWGDRITTAKRSLRNGTFAAGYGNARLFGTSTREGLVGRYITPNDVDGKKYVIIPGSEWRWHNSFYPKKLVSTTASSVSPDLVEY